MWTLKLQTCRAGVFRVAASQACNQWAAGEGGAAVPPLPSLAGPKYGETVHRRRQKGENGTIKQHIWSYLILKSSQSLFQLKTDIDLEKAGLQFISYQELQETVCDNTAKNHQSPGADVEGTLDTTGTGEKTAEGEMGPGNDEGQEEEEVEEATRLVENIKVSDPRRGTEMKMLGLRLGENTATVVAQQITVCLQCNR